MCSLNLLKKNDQPDIWKQHQLKSIAKAVKAIDGGATGAGSRSIEPLFPGSYLCNQLVFCETGSVGDGFKKIVDEVSLNTVYESFSRDMEDPLESYILIDGADLDDVTGSLLVDTVNQYKNCIISLLVLDKRKLGEIRKLFQSIPLTVKGVTPDWRDAAVILSLYRNARHCVFINRHRAIDAAVTGCSMTLIASVEFANEQSTNALWYCLESRSNCRLLGASMVNSEALSSTVAGNSLKDFQQVLNGEPATEYNDWLDEYRIDSGQSQPVIEPCVYAWQQPVQAMLDFRLSVRRKTLKLAEDPKRFCSDSSNPVLKQLGKFLPTREAA